MGGGTGNSDPTTDGNVCKVAGRMRSDVLCWMQCGRSSQLALAVRSVCGRCAVDGKMQEENGNSMTMTRTVHTMTPRSSLRPGLWPIQYATAG